MTAQATAAAHGDGPMSYPLTERRAVTLWLLSRSAMLALSLGWRRDGHSWTDVGLYADWARAVFSGTEPERPLDEYPPLARLFLLFLGWAPSSVMYAAMFIAAMAAIDLLFLRVILNARTDPGSSDIAVLLWILAPALLGGLVWTRFDLLPAVAAACALGAQSGSFRRGAWLGAAVAVKLWPIVLLPSVLMLARRPRRALVAAITCCLCGVVVPSLVVPGDPWGAVTWTLDRGLHVESVTGSIFALAALAGAQVSTAFGFGAWQVVAPGTGAAGVVAGVLGIGLGIAGVAFLRGLTGIDRDRGARLGGLALVVGTLIFAKVLSPQYLVWIIAPTAMVLAVSPPRHPKWIAGLIVAACAATHLIYPLMYGAVLDLQPVGIGLLLLRNSLLAALAVVIILDLRSAARREP
jgi:hypothetical protein